MRSKVDLVPMRSNGDETFCLMDCSEGDSPARKRMRAIVRVYAALNG